MNASIRIKIMKFLLSIALVSISFLSAYAQTPAIVSLPQAEAASRDTRSEAFDKVWTTVNEKHYDPTFGGVDWKKVRDKYEPKAKAAGSDKEFHDVLRQMLAS